MPPEQALEQTSPGFDVDTAMANIEQTGSAESAAAQDPAAQGLSNQSHEFEYVTDGGKKVKEPIDMILKRASMGYHYAQRMADLKKKEAEYADVPQVRQRLSELEKWNEFQEYAAQNPEWAEHVSRSWEERERLRGNPADTNNPVFGELQAVKAQLAEFGKTFQELQQERVAAKRAAEDASLDNEIGSVRKRYTDIDFDLADETGKSLEFRVMEYARENGIRSFKTAFHDFYHDNLVKAREDKAKEEVVRQQKEQRRAGILGTTKEPTKGGLQRAQNTKSKSYDDLAREALDEFGIQ